MKDTFIHQLVFGLALFISSATIAQTGSVLGSVRTSDGSPAEYVNINLKGTSKGAVADKNGHYEITGVFPGSYTLVTSFVGLEKQEKTIELTAGQRVTIDFILKKNLRQLQEIFVSGSRDGYNDGRPSPTLRLNTPLLKTPQNIQVITHDALNDQPVISMSDGLICNVSGCRRYWEKHRKWKNPEAPPFSPKLEAFNNSKFNLD